MFDELVKKAKTGDRKAMGEIIDRIQPLLVSSIRRYYNKSQEYDDLMQEGNMKIIECINDYDQSRGVHFLGYIKMSIRYLYLDKHKERIHGSLNEVLEDGETEIIDLLVGEKEDFLENIIEDEGKKELIQALKSLTPRQKQIISLYYGKDRRIDEIAKELGIAYRTVVNTKTRALEKMRKILE